MQTFFILCSVCYNAHKTLRQRERNNAARVLVLNNMESNRNGDERFSKLIKCTSAFAVGN